jgi:hypothetical protein
VRRVDREDNGRPQHDRSSGEPASRRRCAPPRRTSTSPGRPARRPRETYRWRELTRLSRRRLPYARCRALASPTRRATRRGTVDRRRSRRPPGTRRARRVRRRSRAEIDQGVQGPGTCRRKTYAATTRASRSAISSSHLEGTVSGSPSWCVEKAGPCRSPPFHIKPLAGWPRVATAHAAASRSQANLGGGTPSRRTRAGSPSSVRSARRARRCSGLSPSVTRACSACSRGSRAGR